MKKCIVKILHKNKTIWWMVSFLRIRKRHLAREKRMGHKYYIIGYDDPQSCGWTVWERVVFYNCMYAVEKGMIPIVDMQNYKNIYLEDWEFGKVNAWEKFYLQPGGVLLEEAIKSNDYVIADSSQEWFCYLRERHPKKFADNEFLRKEFNRFVQIKPDVKRQLEERLINILPTNHTEKRRMLAICIRGTDYKTFHHMVQPQIKDVCELAQKVFSKYSCDYYFIATEDAEIFNAIKLYLPKDKLITYNAGNIQNSNGLIGLQIRQDIDADLAAMDYLTTLYCMDRSVCLIGGLCGATIVAKYRRKDPYEYINIIDMKKLY